MADKDNKEKRSRGKHGFPSAGNANISERFSSARNDNISEHNEAKFVGKAKLTKQGQVTVPLEGRKDLHLDSDSELYWYRINDVLVAVKEIVNPKDLLNTIMKRKK